MLNVTSEIHFMKKISLFLCLSFSIPIVTLHAQNVGFTINMSIADSLREVGELDSALSAYKKSYLTDPTDQNNLFNYACLLSIMHKKDSCFTYLNKVIELDTSTMALTDPDFIPLKEDARWGEFEDRLIDMLNIKFKNPYKDIDYAKRLWRMQAKDQAYYSEIKIAENKTGMNSTVVKALWKLKEIYNAENQKELEELIDSKGWPKITDVGGRAAGAAFLIIQHSDYEKQKKYLPIIEKLCKEKEANWSSYALMYDRIAINENKPQKFGSQIRYNEITNKYELFPLLDESKVDDWRKEIGMSPLAEYVARWNIKFEPNKK